MLLMMAQFILQVLLGRAAEGVPVDIDLSKEGNANTISRRQVCYIYFFTNFDLNVNVAATKLLHFDSF